MTEGQAGKRDSGLEALALVAGYHGIAADIAQIRHALGISGGEAQPSEILKAAAQLGLKARIARPPFGKLARLPVPYMFRSNDGNWWVLARCREGAFLVFSPAAGKPQEITAQELQVLWNGEVLLCKSKSKPQLDEKFGFSWFWPQVLKYKRQLVEVLAAMLFIQILGVFSPIITQVVIDKVLVHNSFTTLNAVSAGLLLIAVFELLLGVSKNYIFTHTVSRIDVLLGARLFQRLMSIPLRYFETRRVGDTVARVRELENIRQFLTGTPLATLIDVCFIFVYIAVMFVYSGTLTWMVVASLPLFAILSAVVAPVFKKRLDDKFSAGADNQSYLVEAVNGIQTVKSFAVEPIVRKKWESCLANYIKAGFKLGNLAGIANNIAQVIQKTVDVGILWYGACLVINNQLTVGELIAFRMLSGKVTGPVLRLVQVWQDFQQARVSIERIGDIFTVKPENMISSAQARLPKLQGIIRFEKVRFRYRIDGPEIIRDMTFEIAAGMAVGIVGRSGSGKSTISKLIQRLYIPEGGKIMLDGIDIAAADTAWLRRQIGVVLQENFLFNGSVRDNIALNFPSAAMEQVVEVATLAGAHEFILQLPEGYDTQVGEKGTALSGGQRQRVAIARALLTNPRILIFDEATSALDYESESIIQANLKQICAGRTVIIIAHRLSTIRDAQKIMVIEQGALVEQGTHEELLGQEGYYHNLYRQQL